MILDRAQAGRAVAAAAAQHDADDTPAKGRRGGGKQGIDGRAGMVDQRAVVEMDASGRLQQQVPVGRRHIDAAGLEDGALLGEGGRQLAVPVQDLGQLAGLAADMHHQGTRATAARQLRGNASVMRRTASRPPATRGRPRRCLATRVMPDRGPPGPHRRRRHNEMSGPGPMISDRNAL
jgi:hypothetical protein